MNLTSGTKRYITIFSLGFVFCLSLLWPVSAAAIEQGGIGGRPAHPKADKVRSQSIFVHNINAGEQAKDAVEVINNTAEVKRILVYVVDSQISSGGAFACAQAADQPISAGMWIALAQKEVILNPGAKQTVDFQITVPKEAAPGEHNGCIVVQDTKQQSASDSNGIVLSLRSAIRVAITVPGDIQKGLAFTGLGFRTKGNDKVLLSTALKNSGNVSLDTALHVKLAYPFGASAAMTGGNFPVLSSSEGKFNFEAERPFWGGWYRLVATAHYDDDLANSLGEGVANATASRSMWVFITPDPLAAVIEGVVMLTLVGGTVYFVRRRLHHKRAVSQATEHIVVKGEDLPSIAEQYSMQWKHLARINKLKPPYQLRAGRKLLVTPPRSNKHRKKPSQRP